MRITLATIKSFIRKNRENLYISCRSSFDGMNDCVMPTDNKGFTKAIETDKNIKNTLGIRGAWFVTRSRDDFYEYSDNEFTGYEIYNCCETFILAVRIQS